MKFFKAKTSDISDKTLLKKNKIKNNFYMQYFLGYTALFAVMSLLVFNIFITNGSSLIMKNDDSFFQHYKALVYFGKYIREILLTLFKEHRFIIPQWDFEIGLGSDIISTFSYYSFGDPLNFLSFLVPTKYMHIYYQAMMVFRYYAAGLSFSYLCFKTENKNRLGVMTGAITYIFSAYALRAGLSHPFFINPLIILPLLLLGVEKIIKEKNAILFTLMVAISAFSNFYFFYMTVIFTVIYVAVRFIVCFKTDFKSYIKPFFQVAFSSIIGVMMSAVLFLPTVFAFLSDFRSSVDTPLDIFYNGAYIKIFTSMFAYSTPTTWLLICLSVLFLPCLIMLFVKRKENLHLKIFYVISVIFMIFPIFGKIFNGFSYVSNRWVFAYTLLMSFIIVRMFDELVNADKKQLSIVFSITVATSTLAFCLGDTKSSEMIIPFIFLIATMVLFVIMGKNKFEILYLTEDKTLNIKKTFLQIACMALTIISITNYSSHALLDDNMISYDNFYTIKELNNISYESNKNIQKATKDDKSFWRFTGRSLDINASFINELKSTQYYWSLSNGNISKYRYDMNIAENVLHFYTGLDDRTALNALSSVKYYYNGQYEANKSLPYGYEQLSTRVSENKMYLPLGYTYDSFITREEFDKLPNSIEKQEMMLNTAVLEETTESLKKNDYKPTSKELKYTITHLDDSIAQNGNTFIVDKANSEFVLEFDTVPDSETYFCVKGVEYVPGKVKYNKTTFKLTSTDADNQKYSKSFFYYTPEANFYSGRQDFDVNLGYTESGINKLRFKFPHIGTYKFDEIKIISQPMSKYESSIKELKKDVLENVVVDYNEVSGTIKLDQTKLLCLSIPYSSGWTAVVDGKEAELIQTNGMHSGLLLDKGEHDIKLTYKTPGFRYGIIISLAGIALFTLTAVYYCRKKKKAK